MNAESLGINQVSLCCDQALITVPVTEGEPWDEASMIGTLALVHLAHLNDAPTLDMFQPLELLYRG